MNWLLKIVLYGGIIQTVHFFMGGLQYPPFPFITIVLFLSTVGYFADLWVLPRLGNGLSLLMGSLFILSTLWFVKYIVPLGKVRLPAVLLASILMGTVEYGIHRWIILSKRRGRL